MKTLRTSPASGVATASRFLALLTWFSACVVLACGWVAAAEQTVCGPEPGMRAAALAATEVSPADDYIRCHSGSDNILDVIQHRERTAIAVEFRAASATDTPGGWREFLQKYPTSAYAREALAALRRLTFVEHPATVIVGEQLKIGRTDDADACRTACSYTQGCDGFTFTSTRQACMLWSSIEFGQIDADGHSGSRGPIAVAPRTPEAPARSQQHVTFEEYRNVTLGGTALDLQSAADVSACRTICAENDACKGFSFIASKRRCTTWATVTDRRSAPGTISGRRSNGGQDPAPSPATVEPTFRYEYGVDFRGGDLGDAIRGVSLKECESYCASRTICKAFTFNRTHRACFLKGSIEQRLDFPEAVSAKKR